MWIQILSILLAFILIFKLVAIPIYSILNKTKEYIVPEQSIIKVEPIIKPTYITSPITPQPIKEFIKEPVKYSEIQNFLNNLSDCDWCIACGSYARYTRLEAKKENIEIHEITLTTVNNGGLDKIKYGDGHRINFFYNNDGHRIYIDNTYNWKLILETNELKQHFLNKFNINASLIEYKNIK